eukprot:jgi/Phyca11/506475/fgenesh2_kg.PHYCAscaffold_20_\
MKENLTIMNNQKHRLTIQILESDCSVSPPPATPSTKSQLPDEPYRLSSILETR